MDYIDAKPGYEDYIINKIGGVVIGDRAMNIRHKFKHSIDLAEQWYNNTAYPMVFAVWVARNDVSSVDISQFEYLLDMAIDNIDATIGKHKSKYRNFDLDLYLKKRINYRLDNIHSESIDLYFRYLESLKAK